MNSVSSRRPSTTYKKQQVEVDRYHGSQPVVDGQVTHYTYTDVTRKMCTGSYMDLMAWYTSDMQMPTPAVGLVRTVVIIPACGAGDPGSIPGLDRIF